MHRLLHISILAIFILLGLGRAQAFTLDAYADSSVLAQGRWVKVAVPQTGLYILTLDDLRRMGFKDASRVRVHGYGGRRLSEVLDQADYIDDLPEVQTAVTPQGVVFWALGPETVTSVNGNKSVSLNIYATQGTYFVTEADAPAREIPVADTGRSGYNPAATFTDYVHHEEESVSPGESGWVLVGEDFKYTPTRTLRLALPGKVDNEGPVRMDVSFVSRIPSSGSSLAFSVPGADASQLTAMSLNRSSNESNVHGSESKATRTFEFPGQQMDLTLQFRGAGTVQAAWLNYITVNYPRAISLQQGSLAFDATQTAVRMTQAPSTAVIWDVTDPSRLRQMAVVEKDGALEWVNDYTGSRQYAAFDPAKASSLPRTTILGTVSSQNLHALTSPDMVIVTPRDWYDQACRIAAMHRQDTLDPLEVVVAVDTDIYNEFGSGAADVGALRRFFKMLYDRGLQGQGRPLRYALLMGRATVDNRHLTSAFRNTCGYPTLPQWMSTSIMGDLDDNSGYGTDDNMAILRDGTGAACEREIMDIAIGRMPVRSVSEARSAVDKLLQYTSLAKNTDWRGRVTLLADDENNAVHMRQGDEFTQLLTGTEGSPYIVEKVYIDAYEREGTTYPEARNKMYRLLDQGSAWWGFIGHANNHSWTGEGMLTYTDINNLYLRRQPMLLAATCNFMRWDSNTESGAEIMWHNPSGGIIGAISATRPVYISSNAYMTSKMAKEMAQRDERGHLYTVGEVYRRAKNDILLDYGRPGAGGGMSTNSNARRYVLMADPAMRVAAPHHRVILDTVDGKPIDPDNPPTIAALQQATLGGRVTDPLGQDLPDFDGSVTLTLYDAEYSTTSHGYGGDEGTEYAFDEMGNRLLSVSSPVKEGRFQALVSMPQEISDNWRPATLSMYAVDTASGLDALGVTRDLYAYGRDLEATADTVAPVISGLRLNRDDFQPGDIVNASPMLMCSLTDDKGINLSTAGIGHAMSVLIDDRTTLADVSQYYTPSTDGSIGGSVAYPLSDLAHGPHTLTFKVWDTSGNLATASIDFNVDLSVGPSILDVYTDANPAHTEANFYIRHDRPDAMTSLTVEVYDLLGHAVWTHTSQGRSDMNLTAPVKWDLTDSSGRRVPRGLYLYRATVREDGAPSATTSACRKIAVAAE